jgi:hypothetical protein
MEVPTATGCVLTGWYLCFVWGIPGDDELLPIGKGHVWASFIMFLLAESMCGLLAALTHLRS